MEQSVYCILIMVCITLQAGEIKDQLKEDITKECRIENIQSNNVNDYNNIANHINYDR